MICAYKLWGNEEEVEKGGVNELVRLYVKFHEEAEKDPALDDQGRAWFKKIEDGDEEALRIFNWFKALTLRDTERVYKLLGVTFDSYAGESFYNDKMDRVINELKEKNLLTISEGASIVDLSEDNMSPCIILRSDGATLYATRDLAAAIYRHDTYHSISVCTSWRISRICTSARFPCAGKDGIRMGEGLRACRVRHDFLRGSGTLHPQGARRLSGRFAGTGAEEGAGHHQRKSPNLPNKEDVARQVGIGAVVYTDLSNNRIKDVDFCWDRALNFDGESGPYVQYTHTRCCSVLRKAAEMSLPEADMNALTDDEAQALLRLLGRFPDVIKEAAEKYEPSMITRAVTDIAQAYNKFYYEHRILDGEPATAAARVALTKATKDVIKTGLWLIGIEAPERM